MLKRTTLFAVTAAVIAAGCGQVSERDGTGTPAAPSGQTKQEFIARADAICRRMVTEAEAVKDPKDQTFARALALQGRALKELRALTPPPGDERHVNAVLLHLGRLQRTMSELRRPQGEETLALVAALGVEMDAVARAANRYGLFRGCDAWTEIPELRRIARGQALARRFRVRPSVRPAAHPTVRSPTEDLRRLASELIPAGRSVLRREDCASVGPVGEPTCVTIELAPAGKPLAARRAELAAAAARAGWTELKASNGKKTPGLLVLHRDGYDATVWLARPDCTPQLAVGDGPSPKASTTRCVDSVLVISS